MKFKLNKEEFEAIVKNSLSIADVCRALNLVPVGGNYKTIKSKLKLWNIDATHFTGQGWNVGLKYKPFNKSTPIDKILVENSTYTNTNQLKQKLFKCGLKEKKCEKCGLTHWLGMELSLELHHINGNNLDHRIENMIILCPNCHSLTPHYRGSNNKSAINKHRKSEFEKIKILDIDDVLIETIKNEKKKKYCSCGKVIKNKSRTCLECRSINNRKVERPPIEQLKKEVEKLGYRGTGKKYGVSDNSIRKWVKS